MEIPGQNLRSVFDRFVVFVSNVLSWFRSEATSNVAKDNKNTAPPKNFTQEEASPVSATKQKEICNNAFYALLILPYNRLCPNQAYDEPVSTRLSRASLQNVTERKER